MILALAGEQNVVVLSRALQAGGWLDRDVAAFLLAKFGPDKALVRASHLPDGGTALVASQILMAEHGAQLPPSSAMLLLWRGWGRSALRALCAERARAPPP